MNEEKNADTGFTFYTAHIRFSGSRVGRSKAPGAAGMSASGDSLVFQRDRFGARSRRVRRQLSTKTLPRQGLLVVTVQFSDGSVLPWHRIMEVSAPLR